MPSSSRTDDAYEAVVARLDAMIDHRVIALYRDTVQAFRTGDLVMVLDLSAPTPELWAAPREMLIAGDDPNHVGPLKTSAASRFDGTVEHAVWWLFTDEAGHRTAVLMPIDLTGDEHEARRAR